MTKEQMTALEVLMYELEQQMEHDIQFYKDQLINWEFWAGSLLDMWDNADNCENEEAKQHTIDKIRELLFALLVRNTSNRKKYETTEK